MASDKVYAVVDASGEYLRAGEQGGRTPASNEAQTWGALEEAEAACERATDRVVSWGAE